MNIEIAPIHYCYLQEGRQKCLHKVNKFYTRNWTSLSIFNILEIKNPQPAYSWQLSIELCEKVNFNCGVFDAFFSTKVVYSKSRKNIQSAKSQNFLLRLFQRKIYFFCDNKDRKLMLATTRAKILFHLINFLFLFFIGPICTS